MNSWTSGISGIPSGWTVNNIYSDTREVLVSGGYICESGNKYEKYSVQGLCNGTWQDSGAFVKGDLIESGSSDCDLKKQYLTFTPLSSDTTFQFSRSGLSYSIDNGSTWSALAANTNTPSVAANSKILFKGDNIPILNIGTFSSSDKFNVDGNIMSLIYGDNFSGQTSLSGRNYVFRGLFSGSSVCDAENIVLPATTLAEQCYSRMFSGCTNLTTAPSSIGDSSTTMAQDACGYMFEGCSGLQTAPQLPATTLASGCYRYMFSGCTALTVAPELPATTLAYSCYYYMFRNCTSLNQIKCLATDISASYCTYGWVGNVSSSGTFTKAASMTSWGSGNSGIPTNWTVQDAT